MNFEHVHLPGIFAAIDYNLLPTRYTCLSFTLRVVCVCVSVFVCVCISVVVVCLKRGSEKHIRHRNFRDTRYSLKLGNRVH